LDAVRQLLFLEQLAMVSGRTIPSAAGESLGENPAPTNQQAMTNSAKSPSRTDHSEVTFWR